jgi:hypothetical protein
VLNVEVPQLHLLYGGQMLNWKLHACHPPTVQHIDVIGGKHIFILDNQPWGFEKYGTK